MLLIYTFDTHLKYAPFYKDIVHNNIEIPISPKLRISWGIRSVFRSLSNFYISILAFLLKQLTILPKKFYDSFMIYLNK